MDACKEEAERQEKQQDATFDCVKYYMLSTCPHVGLERGVQHVTGQGGGDYEVTGQGDYEVTGQGGYEVTGQGGL